MLTREGSVAAGAKALLFVGGRSGRDMELVTGPTALSSTVLELFVANVASLSRLLLHHDVQLNVREWGRDAGSDFGAMGGRTDDGVEIVTTGA